MTQSTFDLAKHCAENKVFRVKIDEETRQRWLITPHLKGLSKERQREVAIILENQKLYCSITTENRLNNFSADLDVGKELNFVSKIVRNWVLPELIEVQPLYGPAGLIHFTSYDFDGKEVIRNIQCEDILAKTRNLFRICPQQVWDDGVAIRFRCNFAREVFRDLSNNSGTIVQDTTKVEDLTRQQLMSTLHELSGAIHRKTIISGLKWIVTGPEIAKVLEFDIGELTEPKLVGTIEKRWKLVIDPEFPRGELLVGAKGDNEALAGYFHCPYILRTLPKDGENYAMMTRYGKKLCRNGNRFYGKIIYG